MATFTEVEVYRSITNLLNRDRTWCNSNSTLVYNGALETFVDMSLDINTVYYYKIFAVYDDLGTTIYSSGVQRIISTNVIPDPPTIVSAVATLI